MYGRNLTARGQGGGAGLGFRGSSPPYPYIGRGRGGLPRCRYPGATFPFSGAAAPVYGTGMTSMEEINFLKSQADVMRKDLEEMEARIHTLETKE